MRHVRVLIVILLVLLAWFSTGCRVSKSLQVDHSMIDLARNTTRDSMLRIQRIKDSLHSKEISQVKAAGVVFKETPVPIYITDDVTRDSLLHMIADLNGKLVSVQNEVEILADGSVKARGQIQSAYSTVEMKDREIAKLRTFNDSLLRVIVSDSSHHREEFIQVDQSTKKGTGWVRWIYFIIGVLVGGFIIHNKKRFLSLLKFFNMKLLLILLAATVLLFSCSTKPDNKIYKTDTVHAGFEPSATELGKVEEKTATSYAIEPTWGQSVNFAFQGGYGLWLFLGIASLALFGWFFYTHAQDLPVFGGWDPRAGLRWILIALTLLSTFLCFLSQPINVRQSNRKWVPKEQYEFYMHRDGNIQAIWDSLIDNKLIIGGPYKR